MPLERVKLKERYKPSFPSAEWFQAYGDELSRDPEWKVIGKFFTCTYLIDVSGNRFILTFVDGKLVNVKSNPLIGPLYSKDAWEFAVRAPLDTWKKFMQRIPPAKYHHFFAVTDAKTPQGMIVEGNMKTVWQNIRALTHAMEFLRTFHNIHERRPS
ncbi:MAG: hypothetical protein QXV32_06295 [Conexivisphaerales archaeon]